MKLLRRQFLLLAAGAAMLPAVSRVAWAQAYPTRTITMIVPTPPGGPSDGAARVIGPHMAATLGQNVVIENVGGGNGTIGIGRVTRATPDGHTVLLHNVNMAARVALDSKLPFDIEKELTGAALITFSPYILVSRKDHPANSLAELLSWMKQNGPRVKFAHVGAGSLPHLAAVLLAKSVGVEVNMIPYRGAAPAVTDIVAGHSDLYFGTHASSGELIKSGAVKAFAVTAKERLAAFPDVPSFVQLGYKDLDILFWQALFVRTATPSPVMNRLTQALQSALIDQKVRKTFDDSDMSIFSKEVQTPDGATAMLRNEIKRWGEVIRANKIEALP
jgi:tripartite-type tricarboxylate transporter receptor subunit TctC